MPFTATETEENKIFNQLKSAMKFFLNNDKESKEIINETMDRDDGLVLYSENIFSEFRKRGYSEDDIKEAFAEIGEDWNAAGWTNHKMWFVAGGEYHEGFQ